MYIELVGWTGLGLEEEVANGEGDAGVSVVENVGETCQRKGEARPALDPVQHREGQEVRVVVVLDHVGIGHMDDVSSATVETGKTSRCGLHGRGVDNHSEYL